MENSWLTRCYRIFILLGLSSGLTFISCTSEADKRPLPEGMDFRQEMRNFVAEISGYAKSSNPQFIIIPQNGQELVTQNGEGDGSLAAAYLDTIDGVGREDLFYGYDNDDKATPVDERTYMLGYLDICEANGVEVLVTDYCSTHTKMDDSYSQNAMHQFTSYAAPERDLNLIPDYPLHPFNENGNVINSLSEAKNFLYLIDPGSYGSKEEMITQIGASNYDALIIDLFYEENALKAADVESLRAKANGGSRLVICYMSIGEAEDYRFYWQSSWNSERPAWLDAENPDWEGNYKVRYWDPGWKSIIYGSSTAYLDKILAAGFDGVYLDIIDAFEYFEEY
ncbi:MAG: endo alpha-1,4 polygalactosaminidase [Bacteroidales bacterium]